MTPEQWDRVADWHAAWLAADADGRVRLRQQIAAESPELLVECDALIRTEGAPSGFLETPAFVLTATRLAEDATLEPGTDVGPYRIIDLVGHGGMGVVYRAQDRRLDRDVALKMLSPIGVPGASHIDRFVQEARLTASVDHPNVVKVFDVGVFAEQPYMVTELLDGDTLRARMDRGPVSISDARRITTEIARGLAAAHLAGLVHRDLKPDNIVLTRSGVTKILDFGIAKLTTGDVERRRTASTLTGILLGTVGYLAPEQIRGDANIDARADLFALGSILFEMLTGERAFACENTVDTLHAILHDPMPDLTERRADVPRSLAAITARLLAKVPGDRFQSAADLVWTIEQGSGADSPDQPPASPVVDAPARPRFTAWPGMAAVLATVALVGWWIGLNSRAAPTLEPARFSWTLPAGTGLVSRPVVSPDGRRIVWAGRVDRSSATQLFVRDLASEDARAIQGTEGAKHPFWAPDGRALGFFAGGQLKKVAIESGTPVVLAPAPDARGGAWSPSGVIVFSPIYRDTSLVQISDQGGEVTPVTRFVADYEDVSHRWPAFLPDGRHFLYSIVSGRDERRGVYIGSLDRPGAEPGPRLLASESNAVFVPTEPGGLGVLLSVEGGRLSAQRFDPDTLRVIGDSWTLDAPVTPTSPHHPALMSASANVLAFATAPIPWGYYFANVARDGTGLRVSPEQEVGGFPRVSPDGQRVARTIGDPMTANPDIWVEDHERGGHIRLTTAPTFDVLPVWSPDGREMAYRSGTVPAPHIGFSASDGSGPTRTLPCPRQSCEPTDWSPDNQYLVVNVGNSEVWRLPLDGQTPANPLFAEPFPVRDARLSTDGRWIAYVSAESGRAEVSVRSLTGAARRYVVSTNGGDQPVWRRDGRELFFADLVGHLYSVSVRPGLDGGLSFGPPRQLGVPTLGDRHWGTTYDVTVDGGRVFFPYPGEVGPGSSFNVATGWQVLLNR